MMNLNERGYFLWITGSRSVSRSLRRRAAERSEGPARLYKEFALAARFRSPARTGRCGPVMTGVVILNESRD